jgi:hypothetical protein
MFTSPREPRTEFPRLSAHAAETAGLLPVIVRLCREWNTGSPRDIERLRCGCLCQRFSNIVRAADISLTVDEYAALESTVWQLLESYSKLAYFANTSGQRTFNIVNKHHMMIHMMHQAKFVNPRATWCYSWEDLVGRIQRIAVNSKTALQLKKVPNTILSKYRRALHMALHSR